MFHRLMKSKTCYLVLSLYIFFLSDYMLLFCYKYFLDIVQVDDVGGKQF